MKENTLSIWHTRTRKRYERRNRLANSKGGRRLYCATPEGRKVTVDQFLEPLASFLANSEKPTRPPGDLGDLLCKLSPEYLALAILSPLLDCIARGWPGRDTASWEMRLCLRIGKELRDRLALNKLLDSSLKADREAAKKVRKQGWRAWKFLKPDWSDDECVKAGHWLVFECALRLKYFDFDDDGFPIIAPEWQQEIGRLREELLWRDQVHLPHTQRPPDWTGWLAEYDDRLQATFVRDWHPDTKKAIEDAFYKGNFEHAHGINALQRVAFRIDPQILELIDRFGPEVMNLERRHNAARMKADERLVASDATDARWLSENELFYQHCNCDWRGRVNPIPPFNYAREDHVRALFKFAHGAQLTPESIRWLEIHCANCQGLDKKAFEERIQWASENRELIQKIATNPKDTFDLWKGADKPFRFVAACVELAAALADPTMVTHLPLAFDGSCNGLQHLALLARDAEAAKLVNLLDDASPQDAYGAVASEVRAALEADSQEVAAWWCGRFNSLGSDKKIRDLIKQPVMTYGYGATPFGMAKQVTRSYKELFGLLEPQDSAAFYLARKINEAAERLLPGSAKVRTFIRDLAEHRALQNLPLKWVNPTGFPVSNLYEDSKIQKVYLFRDGVEVRYSVADGFIPGINKEKAINASAPNFVHSLDAAHLIRVELAAERAGIDVVPVHDSFACLAPNASQLNAIIREELAALYWPDNPLNDLRRRNVKDVETLPVPQYGELKAEQVRKARYAWA